MKSFVSSLRVKRGNLVGPFMLMLLLSAIILMVAIAVPAFAADTTAGASSAPTTNDIASSISNYVQHNTNAESTLGVVFGGGAPKLGIGVFVGIYNSPKGQVQVGVKYTAVLSATQENLLGLGTKAKILRFLPGNTPPYLGLIDPSLYATGENDLGLIFKRWRFEAGVSIINLKFSSVLGL